MGRMIRYWELAHWARFLCVRFAIRLIRLTNRGKDLHRRAIGIESNPHWCEVAVERLRQEMLF